MSILYNRFSMRLIVIKEMVLFKERFRSEWILLFDSSRLKRIVHPINENCLPNLKLYRDFSFSCGKQKELGRMLKLNGFIVNGDSLSQHLRSLWMNMSLLCCTKGNNSHIWKEMVWGDDRIVTFTLHCCVNYHLHRKILDACFCCWIIEMLSWRSFGYWWTLVNVSLRIGFVFPLIRCIHFVKLA